MKITNRTITIVCLVSFWQLGAMDYGKQLAEVEVKKTIQLASQKGETIICFLERPIDTVLLYGTAGYCTNGRRGDKFIQGIFITVFGPDRLGGTVGETYIAEDCSHAYKTNIPWSSSYESRKEKSVEIRHIYICAKLCSLRIEIVNPKQGIIKVLKKYKDGK
jgi:hypothetical protein